MRAIWLTLWLIGAVCATSAHGAESQNSGDTFRVGVSSKSFAGINTNDAKAALKVWATSVIKEQNLGIKAEVTVYDRLEELTEALQQDRLDSVSVTAEEYSLMGIRPESLFLLATEQDYTTKYVVIVHHSSGITSLADLKGRTLVRHDGQRMTLALPWLEVVLAAKAKGPAERWLETMSTINNPSKAIFQVFFRQTNASLVTKSAFDLACELNPQLRNELRILAESPSVISAFFFFRPSFQGKSREKLEAAIMELHTTPAGKQVLTIFQSSHMVRQPAAIMETTLQLFSAYKRLGY